MGEENTFAGLGNTFFFCRTEDMDKDDRHWVVDVDDCPYLGVTSALVQSIVSECDPNGDKVELILPTRTGVHLITHPFNLEQFNRLCEDTEIEEIPDVKKNHLTLLFEDL